MESSEVGFLIGKRHIVVHRRHVRPNLVKVTNKETLCVTDYIRLEVYDKEGRLVQSYESPRQQQTKPPKSEKASIEFFFKEDSKELPIIPTCEKLLEYLKRLVEEARLKFFSEA